MKSDLARFGRRLVYIFFVPVKKYIKNKTKQKKYKKKKKPTRGRFLRECSSKYTV